MAVALSVRALRAHRRGGPGELVVERAPRPVPAAGDDVFGLVGFDRDGAAADQAAVRPGEAVLVHGGAGGVGALTVQLAALLGARVTATVRSDAAELVRGFGAQRVIDVRAEPFDEGGPAHDVVIDTVGGTVLDRSFGVLRRGGRPRVEIAARFPLAKGREAFESGRKPGRRAGKTVIVVRD